MEEPLSKGQRDRGDYKNKDKSADGDAEIAAKDGTTHAEQKEISDKADSIKLNKAVRDAFRL